MKDLYNEKHKTPKTKLKKTLEDGKTSIVSGPAESILLLKVIYKLNAIFIKISMTFFIKLEKNAKFHMETQKTLNS
jgi:hypothetical protein